MATIHKHPVPTDSYDPKRPLNDLLIAQFEHFKHIARSLPSDLRNVVPNESSLDDREGVDRFIAAVTDVHVSRKKAKPQLVAKPAGPRQPGTLNLVAAAEEIQTKSEPTKSISQVVPKSKAKRDSVRGPKR